MGGTSWIHWVILLVVVVLIFGTKKLGNMGGDIGKAVKGFKDGVKGTDEESKPIVTTQHVGDKTVIDVESKEKSKL